MRELDVLRDAIVDARELLGRGMSVRGKDTVVGVYDVVTDVDVKVEGLIVDRIRAAFPGDSIISEETAPDSGMSDRTWAIDPIDGTVNMSRGMPMFGMQGVFMEGGVPKASVIALPELSGTYEASAEGAFLDGTRIRTADPRPLRECILSTGDFSRRSEDYRLMQARLMSDCRDTVARFKMFGAACVDFAYLASGRTDIHVRFVNKVWDFMPGMFLADMAGAVYDRDLLAETGILIMCSSRPVLDDALSEILPRITSSCRR